MSISLVLVLMILNCSSAFAGNSQNKNESLHTNALFEPELVPEVTLSVTPIQQETSYFCSAASGQMMLHFFGITSYSQYNLYYNYFTYCEIDNNGHHHYSASAELMQPFLNNQITSKTITRWNGLSQASFNTKIKNSLNNGCPVIMSGHTFPYYTYNDGHFIIIYGYRIGNNPVTKSGNELQGNDEISFDSPDALDNTLRFKIIDPWAPNNTWSPTNSRKTLTTNELYAAYSSFSFGTGNIIAGT